MCQAYRLQYNWDAISGMPTNLYGPNDNFHPENSHVLPALMRRFHEAKVGNDKEVVVWGSGLALREFLHVDDLADAVVFLMDKYSGLEHVNIGSGKECSIKELAELVKEVVGFEGELVWDLSKLDGTPRKLMDSSKLAGLGWVWLEHVNIGSGKECSIKELAELVKEVVGFEGELVWDLRWVQDINACDGLVDTYKWYLEYVKQ
ncbi:hypothetical protein IFM89_017303 [Coptis chinensis]|uniref:NAD-dependent epimerase/dehydratase domain-containing protein n=1 Tax=Coptis chinensis TaxID=261450 RepID=A0A835LEN8_9MAGN|nr:hypothetical protein IFM89_017303 [Coptis chinensis]